VPTQSVCLPPDVASPMKASVLFSVVLLALVGCVTSGPGEVARTGGATSSGGRQEGGSGGSGSGGAAGSSATNTSGGTTGSGGTTSSGGTTTTGGSSAGGTTSVGGTTTGGTSASGGSSSGGGTTGSGGRQGTGGVTAGGGATATGGVAASGGTTASAGRTGTSTDATGGSGGRDASADAFRGTVDTAACTPGETCTEADKTVTSGSGKHCCYTYENWVGSGTASITLKTDGFSANWSNAQFVGRKGIRPGSGDLVVDYSANFQPNGNGYLCVYGWTTEPLVEYYVLESWGSYKPPGGSSLGTVSSDGGTYDIYKSMRNNQPSIQGTATFPQYWSVRQQKRTSGTITIANHIKAWAGKSMPMGTFYEVSMTVEGYQSSGTADVKFSMK
jgi:endo-1,4-beta-xylanase